MTPVSAIGVRWVFWAYRNPTAAYRTRSLRNAGLRTGEYYPGQENPLRGVTETSRVPEASSISTIVPQSINTTA